MQHLEVSCAVRRFFKSLGFKGLNFLEPSGPLQACNGTALPYLLILPLNRYELNSNYVMHP